MVQARAGNRDIAPSYTSLVARLQRIVARNVTAPPAVIEDACQAAWTRWCLCRDDVAPGSLLAWLATTATREALRMVRARGEEVPLEGALGPVGAQLIELPARIPGPGDLVEMRERLAEVRRLPVREQRILWLQGLGFDYGEIGACTGDSRRTVERQLDRARRHLRESR